MARAITILQHPIDPLAATAATAVARLGGIDAEGALRAALEDPRPDVRAAALPGTAPAARSEATTVRDARQPSGARSPRGQEPPSHAAAAHHPTSLPPSMTLCSRHTTSIDLVFS